MSVRVYMVMLPAMNYVVTQQEWVRRTQSRWRLVSFMYLMDPKHRRMLPRAETLLKECSEAGCGVMLDSSAHSFQGNKIKPTSGLVKKYELLNVGKEEEEVFLQKYVAYCRKEGPRFDCYVNFDSWVSGDLVYNMQKRLEGEGLKPVPVFHGAQGMDHLKKYLAEGYDYIGISKTLWWRDRYGAREFFKKCFRLKEGYPGVRFHGFGVTDVEQLFRFPWYSVDSSTWAHYTRLGMVVLPLEGKLRYYHVSLAPVVKRLSKSAIDVNFVRGAVEKLGFDFERMRYWGKDKEAGRLAWLERGYCNMYMFSHLREQGVTSRGETGWQSLSGS